MNDTIQPNGNQTVKLWWVSMALGVLLIVIGAIIVKRPLDSFYALSIFLGIPLLISGAIEVYFSVVNRKILLDWSWYTLAGIVDFLIGLFLMTKPQIILLVLTILVGIWLVSKGVIAIRRAIQMKSADNKNWVWLLVLGVLILAFTLVLIISPNILGKALSFWIAISFILLGVYRVYLAFVLKKIEK